MNINTEYIVTVDLVKDGHYYLLIIVTLNNNRFEKSYETYKDAFIKFTEINNSINSIHLDKAIRTL